MTASEQMLALVEGSKNLRRLCREYETESVTVHLKELVGGAFSLYAAATIRRTGGVHVFVAEDRDAAAYLLNDLYALLDERRILFFPSSYKRSIVYGAEDAQGVVQRTAALNALRTPPAGYLALCTYPEALAERVVDAEALRRETMTVRAGDHLRPADLVEWLDESGFVRVDFVYEPGQYSQRGGIVDVFSYSESKPYRLDFFGDEVDSIRRFNISSQLSQDKLQQAEIIPNLNAREGGRVSLVEAAGGLPEGDVKVLNGGPMMGRAMVDLSSPVTKGCSGITVLGGAEAQRGAESACIKCAKCVQACPMGLEPYLLSKLSRKQLWERLEGEEVTSCIECGCCQFTCPADLPLLDYIRLGKQRVMGLIRARAAANAPKK